MTYVVNGDMGFNPRICKRCDNLLYTIKSSFIVSIHASVKDATQGGSRIGKDIPFQSTHL